MAAPCSIVNQSIVASINTDLGGGAASHLPDGATVSGIAHYYGSPGGGFCQWASAGMAQATFLLRGYPSVRFLDRRREKLACNSWVDCNYGRWTGREAPRHGLKKRGFPNGRQLLDSST